METLNKLKPDTQAIRIARQIHEVANAQQTFLFGSRARGTTARTLTLTC